MGKWGWMVVSIGCIVIMYSQSSEDFASKMLNFGIGLAIVIIGGIMSYKGYKNPSK